MTVGGIALSAPPRQLSEVLTKKMLGLEFPWLPLSSPAQEAVDYEIKQLVRHGADLDYETLRQAAANVEERCIDYIRIIK